jgi:hypothetical protein
LKFAHLGNLHKFFAAFLLATFALKSVKASCRRLFDVRTRYRADCCLWSADDWRVFCGLLSCCSSCFESDSTALNFLVPWEISETLELPKFYFGKGFALLVGLGCKLQ